MYKQLRKFLSRIFVPSVDNAINSINKSINKLDTVAMFHNHNAVSKSAEANKLLAEAKEHDKETDRAASIRTKLLDLVS